MSSKHTVALLVTLDVPKDVTVADLINYVHGEVVSGCGSRHPDDPLFCLDRDSVRVSYCAGAWKSGVKRETANR